jgi:hypothetical protein
MKIKMISTNKEIDGTKAALTPFIAAGLAVEVTTRPTFVPPVFHPDTTWQSTVGRLTGAPALSAYCQGCKRGASFSGLTVDKTAKFAHCGKVELPPTDLAKECVREERKFRAKQNN